MERLPGQIYTGEFGRQAVEMVRRERLSIAEASRRLSLSPKSVTNWVRRAKNGSLPDAAPVPGREVTEAEAEVWRLRLENAELRMEREILKRASAYCAQESRRGSQ